MTNKYSPIPTYLLFVPLLACGNNTSNPAPDPSDVAGNDAPSLCTACAPLARATSSGSTTVCEPFQVADEVTANEAADLGFDIDSLVDAAEDGINAPLAWKPHASLSTIGGSASGYEANTRIAATVEIASLRHIHLDPVLCDASTCRKGDVELARSTCNGERLEIGISSNVTTADESVAGTVTGKLEQQLGSQQISGSAGCDLRDATGNLRIEASSELPTHQGELVLNLELRNGALVGQLYPQLRFTQTSGATARQNELSPVWGYFPPATADQPAGSAGQ